MNTKAGIDTKRTNTSCRSTSLHWVLKHLSKLADSIQPLSIRVGPNDHFIINLSCDTNIKDLNKDILQYNKYLYLYTYIYN